METQWEDVFIFGAGGLAKEVTLLIGESNAVDGNRMSVAAYVTVEPTISELMGSRVISEEDFLDALAPDREVAVVLAVGSSAVRRHIVEKLAGYSIAYPSLRHPSVAINSTVRISPGVVLCADVRFTVDAHVGAHTYINHRCMIGHDVVIGEFVQMNAQVCVSGEVHVEDDCLVGAASVIHQGVTVGRGATVGLGAVVLSDVPPQVTVVGNPARPVPSGRAAPKSVEA